MGRSADLKLRRKSLARQFLTDYRTLNWIYSTTSKYIFNFIQYSTGYSQLDTSLWQGTSNIEERQVLAQENFSYSGSKTRDEKKGAAVYFLLSSNSDF